MKKRVKDEDCYKEADEVGLDEVHGGVSGFFLTGNDGGGGVGEVGEVGEVEGRGKGGRGGVGNLEIQ